MTSEFCPFCPFNQTNRNTPVSKLDPIPNTMKNPYNPESSRVVPIPEGRMRAQEASRYSNSLEANISNRMSSATAASSAMPSYRNVQTTRASTKQSQKVVPKNPFDEDDDAQNAYDETKNPFADEPDAKPITRKAERKLNPFDDVDDNSNPFN